MIAILSLVMRSEVQIGVAGVVAGSSLVGLAKHWIKRRRSVSARALGFGDLSIDQEPLPRVAPYLQAILEFLGHPVNHVDIQAEHIDFHVHAGSELQLVRYKPSRFLVSADDIRRLATARLDAGFTCSLLVTNSFLSDTALAVAKQEGVAHWDCARLRTALDRAQRLAGITMLSPSPVPARSRLSVVNVDGVAWNLPTAMNITATIQCAVCGKTVDAAACAHCMSGSKNRNRLRPCAHA
jgi:hypothetical protein